MAHVSQENEMLSVTQSWELARKVQDRIMPDGTSSYIEPSMRVIKRENPVSTTIGNAVIHLTGSPTSYHYNGIDCDTNNPKSHVSQGIPFSLRHDAMPCRVCEEKAMSLYGKSLRVLDHDHTQNLQSQRVKVDQFRDDLAVVNHAQTLVCSDIMDIVNKALSQALSKAGVDHKQYGNSMHIREPKTGMLVKVEMQAKPSSGKSIFKIFPSDYGMQFK